jgi:hypothetical protein
LSQGIRDCRKFFALHNFTPHDLRRTSASLMTANGVTRLHVEKVLNHTIDDVAEIYDRHDYLTEKRAALVKLDECVMRILGDSTGYDRAGTAIGPKNFNSDRSTGRSAG